MEKARGAAALWGLQVELCEVAEAFPGARGNNNVPFTPKQREQRENGARASERVRSVPQLEHKRVFLCHFVERQGANIPYFPERSKNTSAKSLMGSFK